MIIIKEAIWRADCIASIDTDEDCTIQILPVNCSETMDYTFDDRKEMTDVYKKITTQWMKELGQPIIANDLKVEEEE